MRAFNTILCALSTRPRLARFQHGLCRTRFEDDEGVLRLLLRGLRKQFRNRIRKSGAAILQLLSVKG